MRLVMRFANVAAGLLPLASGLAVLVSALTDPGYRAHYGDPLWLVALYVAFYLWVVVAFARGRGPLARLAVAKTLGAYAFVLTFAVVGDLWMSRTPGRYVYELFDWGAERKAILMAYVMIGRGVWNTLNAMYFTAAWWVPLRKSRPFVGRVTTAAFVGIALLFVWAFQRLVKMDAETFSVEAHEVARTVHARLECETIRAREGNTTRDLRERADRRYVVDIRYDCRDTQVVVKDPDGRIGQYRASREECCDQGKRGPLTPPPDDPRPPPGAKAPDRS
jgi:hypothetical protein